LACAALGLLLLSPLLALVALLIKFDSPGPVLFRQTRLGFNGRPFKIFKFRTMNVLEDGAGLRQATPVDERTTSFGRWLRRMSIDELPQLFNVLKGDMSIVGPRPHAVAHDEQFERLISHYAYRRRMKPGITGFAQVNGYRGGTPKPNLMESRVKLDILYIENWSIWLDISIVARTLVEVVRGNNAY
jgi:putative colanic acid biosynthesis UDP-glucose lipid carrier transferase